MQASSFPITCLHLGIIELSGGPSFHHPLFECCEKCKWPKFATCQSNGDPEWLCASRAYKCICDCRVKHVETTDVKVIVQYKSRSSYHSKSLVEERDDICKKKICNHRGYGYNNCCVEEQCIHLNTLQKDAFYTKYKTIAHYKQP